MLVENSQLAADRIAQSIGDVSIPEAIGAALLIISRAIMQAPPDAREKYARAALVSLTSLHTLFLAELEKSKSEGADS